jgi:adenine-specific DNA-methyltransferase
LEKKTRSNLFFQPIWVSNDTIFLYSKSNKHIFNSLYSKNDHNTKKYINERFVFEDNDGRKYMKSPLVNHLNRPNLKYIFHGINPPKTGWLYSQDKMESMFINNELVMPKNSDSEATAQTAQERG